MLRTIVIGIGAGIFQHHRPAIEQMDFELVGAVGIALSDGQNRAKSLNIPFYTDRQQLFQEVEADIAVILTPHPSHADIAIDCLNAGCHVLVEKPIAIDIADADRMVEAAEQNGKLLMVNFQQRFRPEIRAIYNLIQQGKLGAVQHISLALTWSRPAAYFAEQTWRGTWQGEGGGVLMNQAPHDLDKLCYFLGLPQEVVAWTPTQRHAIETEDTVHAMLKWESGALGSVHISTAEAGPPPRLEIWGTKGYIQLIGDDLTFHQLEVDVDDYIRMSTDFYTPLASQPMPIEYEDITGDHRAIYEHLHAVLTEGIPCIVDGKAAKQSLEVANAMLLSGATGETIPLPLDRKRYSAFLNQRRNTGR